MLTFLKIENVATVRQAVLEPGPGLNVLTGETGAGKSIVVEALALALGGRGRRDLLRTGCDRGSVTAGFDLAANPEASGVLAELGVPPDEDGLLVIKREIAATGRHRILCNGEPATAAMLGRLGGHLGEIHGQHEGQRLVLPATHGLLLDAFAGLGAEVDEVTGLVGLLTEVGERLDELDRADRDRAERLELVEHQLAEIAEARLGPAPAEGVEDEDARVAREQQRLARAEEVADGLATAVDLLHADDGAAVERVSRAGRSLAAIAPLIPELPDVVDELEEARVRLEEAARTLAALADEDARDPAELLALESRLALLERLKRRHGPTLRDVRDHAAGLERLRDDLVDLDDRRAALVVERDAVATALAERAGALSRKRRETALSLTRRVRQGLRELDMPGARFEVDLSVNEHAESPVVVDGRHVACGPRGIDRIQFLLSANAGEEARPLGRVASGGELSRVMLVLRGLVAGRAAGRAWVFDEVDAGLGGQAALRVGERLAALADAGAQVFVVTHLPQVASRASVQHHLSKRTRGSRTETSVRRLEGEDRVGELARMLSGRDSRTARRHAAEMLAAAAGVGL